MAAVRRERELPVPELMRLHTTRAPAGFRIMPEQLAVIPAGNESAPVREQNASAGERLMLFFERLSFSTLRVHSVERSVGTGSKCAGALGRDGEAKHSGGQLVIVREGEFHPKKSS